jgi:hypothetical protein
MEKRYFKSGNRNLIAMYKNELQTQNNLPFAAITGQSGEKLLLMNSNHLKMERTFMNLLTK